MITDLFNYTSDLREFAPQMPTDGSIENFEPHFRPQQQKLENIIGKETFDKLVTYFKSEGFDATSVTGKAVVLLRASLANLTAIPYFIFEASQRNNTQNNLYRYQEDQQIETYLENAWTELNYLLNHLESNTTDFSEFTETEQYKIRQALFIKNAKEFKRYYGVVDSAYFFNNTVFIIEEVQNDEIAKRFKDFITVEDATAKFNIGKAIVYETLSRACKQLDYTELPRGIRNDIIKEINAKNGKEIDIKNSLSAFFHNKAAEYFLKIEDFANKSRNAGKLVITENTLSETDKFYMP